MIKYLKCSKGMVKVGYDASLKADVWECPECRLKVAVEKQLPYLGDTDD